MYEVMVRSKPDVKLAFLDGLVLKRDHGELVDHIARLAKEKCPKSKEGLDRPSLAALAGAAGWARPRTVGYSVVWQPPGFRAFCRWGTVAPGRSKKSEDLSRDRVYLRSLLRDHRHSPARP